MLNIVLHINLNRHSYIEKPRGYDNKRGDSETGTRHATKDDVAWEALREQAEQFWPTVLNMDTGARADRFFFSYSRVFTLFPHSTMDTIKHIMSASTSCQEKPGKYKLTWQSVKRERNRTGTTSTKTCPLTTRPNRPRTVLSTVRVIVPRWRTISHLLLS